MPLEPVPLSPVISDQLEGFFKCLKELDFSPRHIVDIGANRGNWTRTALQYFPEANYTLLEPQPQMRAEIQDLLAQNQKVTLHSVGAGASSGELLFTIHLRDDSCTFAMTREEAERLGLKQVIIPVVALDDLLSAASLPAPEMIKIDAEGLDLEVLKGGARALSSAEIVLVEAGVANRSFSNEFGVVIKEIYDQGFRLFDITDLNRTPHRKCLWLTEVAFIRSDCGLAARSALYI